MFALLGKQIGGRLTEGQADGVMRPQEPTEALVRRRFSLLGGVCPMVTIVFADRDAERRALAYLLGRFSGRVVRSGEHLVPEAALEALADQNISFTVKGKTSYEQQVAALRGDAPAPVQ